MADGSKRCSAQGCGRQDRLKRGLCPTHYQRERNHGDANWQPAWEPLSPRNAAAPVGRQSGRWTVLAEAPRRYGHVRYWLCRCECGTEREVARAAILRQSSPGCGCHRRKSATCTRADCGKPTEARELCRQHYVEWKRSRGLLCAVAGCTSAIHAHGMCELHAAWLRRYGEPRKPERVKAIPTRNRYVHLSRNGVQKPEHVWLMEDLLGRPLERTASRRAIETVHHVNGIKHDNRTDGPLVNFRSGNLELWSNSHPSGQRVSDKVSWAVELLKLYAPDWLA